MSGAGDHPSTWADAALAAALFAIDASGLGGVSVRSAPSPVRDAWLELMRTLLPADAPLRRAPLRIEDDRLLGGLDLTASLAAGRPIAQRGLLAECDGGVALLPMAERIEAAAAARFAAALDDGEVALERSGLTLRAPSRLGVIALDEGLTPEERPPAVLLERLALRVDLSAVSAREAAPCGRAREAIDRARARLASVAPPDPEIVQGLCEAADVFAIRSIRGPIFALRAARAIAALDGRAIISIEDAALAARLVLAPRALAAPGDQARAPEDAPSDAPSDAPALEPSSESPTHDNPQEDHQDAQGKAPTEILVAAIEAALPEDVVRRLTSEASVPRARAPGSGAQVKSARRGRPIGARGGALHAGDRLNLVATLRAAAPWQKLRGAARGGGQNPKGSRMEVRRDDFRIQRFVQRAEATTIFVVDASGSAALQRLGEAKGAVELLLAKAYISRRRVALIAFRGAGAELLLPPTRSLTRAKRCLASLPGGGGTPLAEAIDVGLTLAQREKAHARTPFLVFLTDGRANIARRGAPGRAAAEADALDAARRVEEARIGAVFIDTSARAQPGGDKYARAMGAAYAPLPYVNADAMFALVDKLRVGPQ